MSTHTWVSLPTEVSTHSPKATINFILTTGVSFTCLIIYVMDCTIDMMDCTTYSLLFLAPFTRHSRLCDLSIREVQWSLLILSLHSIAFHCAGALKYFYPLLLWQVFGSFPVWDWYKYCSDEESATWFWMDIYTCFCWVFLAYASGLL